MDALEGRVNLDAGRWDLPNSGRADEPKAGGDAIQVRMSDSGGVLSAVCPLMVAAVIVGMKKESNEEKKDVGQRTLKDWNTDARVITEGARSTAFDAEACLEDAVDDPGGLFVEDIPYAGIDDESQEIYWRDQDLVSADENFTFDKERDLPVVDLIVDESRGSNGLEGLDPDGISIEDMLRTSSVVAVVTESVWDVGWHWPVQYFGCYSQLGEPTEVVDEGKTEGGPQIVGALDLKTIIAETVDWNWSRQRMDRALCLDTLAWAVALIG